MVLSTHPSSLLGRDRFPVAAQGRAATLGSDKIRTQWPVVCKDFVHEGDR